MTDLDELTAYAQRWIVLHRENKYQREAAKIMQRVVDALVSVTAERDTALSEKAHWYEVATTAKDQRDAAEAAVRRADKNESSWINRTMEAETRAEQAEARIAQAAEQLAEVLDQHDKDEDGATEYLDPTSRRLQVAIRALNRVDRIVKALGLDEGENDVV